MCFIALVKTELNQEKYTTKRLDYLTWKKSEAWKKKERIYHLKQYLRGRGLDMLAFQYKSCVIAILSK
jgi:hypothetical protein